MIGALGGIHLAGKSQVMKDIYWVKQNEEITEGEKQADESSKLNTGTLKKILFWWSITIPCALSFTAFLLILINLVA